MRTRLRVVIADDERPARAFLAALLRSCDDVELVGEAESGTEALALIERETPLLALLDLQMPELDGLGVARALKGSIQPLVAFVTAYDDYAIQAFEIHALDYLLKPVEQARLRETLNRAHERAARADHGAEQATRVAAAGEMYEAGTRGRAAFLERIPVRRRDEVVILPVNHIASIVADGELLHLTTTRNEHHTITYRLKDLEARLDPSRFLRLARGTLVQIDAIVKVNAVPGGTHVAVLNNGQKLPVSRLQSRILREHFLRL